MKKFLVLALLLWEGSAFAQFIPGQVLTAAELNSQFALYAPVSGVIFTGPVAAPTVAVNGTGNSTSPSTGALTTAGGLGVVQDIYAGGSYHGSAFITAGSITNTPIGQSGTVYPGAFSTVTATGTITPSQTAGIVGTNTNNNANPGSIGEYVSANVLAGSPVSLTSLTPANVTSITLSPGDWEVSGCIGFIPSATVNGVVGGINSTSATIPSPANGAAFNLIYTSNTAGAQVWAPTGSRRFSIAITTTVYLVAQCNFASGTCGAFGVIQAWRRR